MRKNQFSVTNTAQLTSVSHTNETESTLIFSGMALCIIKLLIYGPSLG